jgi:predicted dehydrogenase
LAPVGRITLYGSSKPWLKVSFDPDAQLFALATNCRCHKPACWGGDLTNTATTTAPSLVSTVIVGAGKVGSRFDEEPGRTTVWTHAGAYLACAHRFRLTGVCELDATNAEAFRRRCPQVPIFTDLATLLTEQQPELVSICTPGETHGAVLNAALKSTKLQAVWCEKPLATNLNEAATMVEACARRAIPLVVSYVRRWMPIWRRARAILENGTLGRPRVVRVALPNRIWTMGSHGIDLVQVLGGAIIEVVPLALPQLEEEGEPAVAAHLRLKSGAYGILQVTGCKANYLVEAEIVGDAGRLLVREDCGLITLELFEPSRRYQGYKELSPPTIERIEPPAGFSPFIAIAEEIADLLSGAVSRPTCDGAAALAVQHVLARLVKAA